MNKTRLLVLAIIPTLLLVGCNKSSSSSPSSSEPEPPVVNYDEKEVDIYREKNTPDKKFPLRFYHELPNVPYVSVSEYFKEFFKREFTIDKQGSTYYYINSSNDYLGFDTEKNEFICYCLESFSSHPDFPSSNSKVFLKLDKITGTSKSIRNVNLNNYGIKLFDGEGEAYVPISFLSSLVGGHQLYDIAYNGQDLYMIDWGGQFGEAKPTEYYGDAYRAVLDDTTTTRPKDLAEYTYGELCFAFDNLRGYTEQLVFGDNNLVSLGLNGLLEQYHPKIKEYLLSLDKNDYYEGLNALFYGLYDGGHTVELISSSVSQAAVDRHSETDFTDLIAEGQNRAKDSTYTKAGFILKRLMGFPGEYTNGRFYHYDGTYKIAYIGFDKFDIDIKAWDSFYKGAGEVPVDTDTYAWVRSKLYQAKDNGAENVVLDLTANDGGDSWALCGLVGLLNGAKADFDANDTFNQYRVTEKYLVDVNLDGLYNDADVTEANSFNFNVGILTSSHAFSCGNLFPSILKELGYKILGEKTGGGSCAIAIQSTGDGVPFVQSSYICLSDKNGNNIDGGVPVDFPIDIVRTGTLYNVDAYFDFENISNYLSHAYDA